MRLIAAAYYTGIFAFCVCANKWKKNGGQSECWAATASLEFRVDHDKWWMLLSVVQKWPPTWMWRVPVHIPCRLCHFSRGENNSLRGFAIYFRFSRTEFDCVKRLTVGRSCSTTSADWSLAVSDVCQMQPSTNTRSHRGGKFSTTRRAQREAKVLFNIFISVDFHLIECKIWTIHFERIAGKCVEFASAIVTDANAWTVNKRRQKVKWNCGVELCEWKMYVI